MKKALLQAIILMAAGFILGVIYNSFNENGIHPLRKLIRFPVVTQDTASTTGAEAIRIITLDEARSFVERGGRVLDARTKQDYDEGHIPGAILFDYYSVGTYSAIVLPMLSPQETIMVYCSERSCDDSEMLARELFARGYRRLLLFRGGFAEWSAANLPVEMAQ